ncbi:MAG TPA: DUF3300 domain-containing protein, partial [Magnetospirillaceae bacterium]|nr:DUF3300 domain-containing protein [Magnetospirillaceae bacterium]
MDTMGWRVLAGAVALALAVPAVALAQDMPGQDMPAQEAPVQDMSAQDMPAQDMPAQDPAMQGPAPEQQAAAPGSPQLASILAPVALYPDPLLNDILTASTYPLEVVEADRWLSQPANAMLSGDQLLAALQQQDWDPSVKSLVPFPPILKMMDNQLDWTKQLGNAFLSEQDQVMDTVQQLRRQAETAGGLVSTPQQTVADRGGAVDIEPVNPQDVSIPAYDPGMVYGAWPYPEVPPDAFAAYDPGDFDEGYADGWFFGPPIVLFSPVWFWGHFDWHHH